jgi:pimeloyl-ACP methyl ester carboxylesterase
VKIARFRRPIAYGVAALAIWLPLLDGLVANVTYSSRPEILRNSGVTKRDTAFVFFTGTQSSGRALSAPMLSTWYAAGDVVTVEYPRNHFDGPAIIADTFAQLRAWGYRKVIISGASLGGMMATDLIDYNREKGSPLQVTAVLMEDAPASSGDLVQSGGAQFMSYWHAGPVANLLFTKVFWAVGFKPPARDKLGEGVNDAQLNKQYSASNSYPLSGWTGELRYMVKHPSYKAGQYAGIPLIIMRSEKDVVVKTDADCTWESIFQGGQVIKVPTSTHIGFVEYPEVWRTAFVQAFQALGTTPVG